MDGWMDGWMMYEQCCIICNYHSQVCIVALIVVSYVCLEAHDER